MKVITKNIATNAIKSGMKGKEIGIKASKATVIESTSSVFVDARSKREKAPKAYRMITTTKYNQVGTLLKFVLISGF
jgi:hypothetical protein